MKYLFFCAAVLGIFPATFLLLSDRRWIRRMMFGLILPLLLFNATAINFFSHEFYRGTSRGMEISVIYIGAAVLLLTFSLLKGACHPFPERGSRFYLLYFLCCLPSLLSAENLLFSFFELWKMGMIHLVFLAAYYYLDYSGGDFEILLAAVGVVVMVDFGVIVYQHFRGMYQVRGVFPHQNSLAMCMMLAGPVFFARFFQQPVGWGAKLSLLVFGTATLSLMRTYSRGALICYPVGGAVTLLAVLRSSGSARKILHLLPVLPVGLLCLLLFLPRIVERFEKAPESSGEGRKNYAVAAMNMMKDRPWTGVGLNNWGIKINPPYEYSRHRNPERGYTEDFKDGIAETVYLLTGAECGLPALAALLLWFGYYWFSALRLLKYLKHSRYFYLPAGLLGGLTAVFLQASLEWVLRQQINFMWLILAFAVLSYLNQHGKELMAEESALSAGKEA